MDWWQFILTYWWILLPVALATVFGGLAQINFGGGFWFIFTATLYGMSFLLADADTAPFYLLVYGGIMSIPGMITGWSVQNKFNGSFSFGFAMGFLPFGPLSTLIAILATPEKE